MRLIPDTHLLIWFVGTPVDVVTPRMARASTLLRDAENEVMFSAASIWEVAIKFARKVPSFTLSPVVLRRSLLAAGFAELPVTSAHAERVLDLPPIHKDPFDRLLLAQAIEEDLLLATADSALTRYPGPILKV